MAENETVEEALKRIVLKITRKKEPPFPPIPPLMN
jgi:hypothetical protein